jgi:primosomal protein N' (replication factor Y)
MELFEKFVYADVCLPLAMPQMLTYAFPESDAPKRGARVVVPLRGSKLYTGIVWKTGVEKPEVYRSRRIAELIDREIPYADETRLQFLEWMASYYLCTQGEILLAAIPAAHRLSSESHVQLPPEISWIREESDEEDNRLLDFLVKKQKITLSELMKISGSPAACLKRVRRMEAEGMIQISDELTENFRQRTDNYLCLAPEYCTENGLDELFGKIKKSDEEAFVLYFLQHSRFSGQEVWSVRKDKLYLDADQKKVLSRLQKRGIFEIEKRRQDPYGMPLQEDYTVPDLSDDQFVALKEIQSGFQEEKTCLLFGVTGSGKTEIYIHLITEALAKNKQCLLMLPEIAITVQIVARLRKVFGESMAVYHSRAGIQEKMAVWEGLQKEQIRLVVGVRSSVFLPFSRLGLLIVDEEHDPSYKQSEPPPRYHGRDTAIYLASLHKAKVLLGSATPSVESYYKAESGKWKMIKLLRRFGESSLPEIRYVDMRQAAKNLRIRLDIAEDVLDGFRHTKDAGRQSILFQNRRGYAPFMECQDCGWVPYCPSCDVSLTLHQARAVLSCHYCGHHTGLIFNCYACGSVRLQAQGYGTEKLEESLQNLLPDFRIARMDQDTTSSKRGFENLLEGMSSGNTDILVGTQMVTKGLDFENVTFVAVFDIDRMLHYPDFRANERAFQLLSQIAGRAGRRKVQGEVLIQTRNPGNMVLKMVAANKAEEFYENEIRHREDFLFPPFCRLIRITVRHKEEEQALAAADRLRTELENYIAADWLSGPEQPVIPRIRNQFIYHLHIKIPSGISPGPAKEVIRASIRWMEGKKDHPGVHWMIDPDPN